jgi:hypothetical protein
VITEIRRRPELAAHFAAAQQASRAGLAVLFEEIDLAASGSLPRPAERPD